MEDGPPIFRQDFTCPALLFVPKIKVISCKGLSPAMAGLPKPFHYLPLSYRHRALPRSLAAT